MDFKTKLPNVFSIVAVHIFASMRNTEKKRYLSVWCHGPKKVDFFSPLLEIKRLLVNCIRWNNQEGPF